MKGTIVMLVVAVAVTGSAAAAGSASVKRLAWNKAAAAWTAQAKKKHHAITCSAWAPDASGLSCVVYNPAEHTGSPTIINGVPRVAYGKIAMSRYDQNTLDVEPHAGCTYGFSVYGSDLTRSRSFVVNICERGWLARLPAAP